MRRALLIAALAAGLVPAPTAAQTTSFTQQTVSANSTGGGCSTANSCASFTLGSTAVITMQVTGTFSLTLTPEATTDNTNWVTITLTKLGDGTSTTSITATGQYSVNNSGIVGVRLRATSYSSGSAVVTAVRGYASAKLPPFSSSNPVPPASGGTGITSYAIGDLITASGATTLVSLPDVATGSVLASGGVTTAPAYTANPSVTTVTAAGANGHCFSAALGCIKAPSDGVITLLNNAGTGFSRLQFGGTTSSFPSIKQTGAGFQFRLADDSAYATINVASLGINTAGSGLFFTSLAASATPPSAPSSCGSSPAVTTSNGTTAWVVTGGTGGTATGCTTTMPAATTGWNCFITNITQTAAHRADRTTVQTASTTTSVTWEYQTVSTGAATAFTASDVFRGVCFAY